MIVLNCPRCNQRIEVSDFLAGFTVVCKSCKSRVDVPRDSQAAENGAVGKDQEPTGDQSTQASPVPVSSANGTNDDPKGTPIPGGARFRILRLHAKGGLGLVSVAHDDEFNREVALKEIQECHADDRDSRSRFLIEAEITGRLEHPGVVPVYALGRYADGRPFYAMRLIKGDSLKEVIERYHKSSEYGRDPGEQTLELRRLLGRFINVCQTIQYAHDRGILHRDLKPSNIMLGKYGETLVVDWGVAKALGKKEVASAEATLKPASDGNGSKTLPGSAIGTPAFMSPEQAAGRLDQLGPASDVYSLGATLYALLTGSAPFEDPDIAAILNKVQHGDFPRPRLMNPYTDPALEAICLKAMSLKIVDRYESPRALADDLERWLADKPVTAWPEPWTAKTRRWVGEHRTLMTGTVAALLVGVVSLLAATALLTEANETNKLLAEKESNARKDADERRKQAQSLADDNKRLAEEETKTRLEVDKGRKEALKLAEANKLLAEKETKARTDADERKNEAIEFARANKLLAEKEMKARLEADERREVAEELALRIRFELFYSKSREDPSLAMVGAASLLPMAARLKDQSLLESMRLHLGAWCQDVHRLTAICVHSPSGNSIVRHVAFSPDGKTVVTGHGKSARLWDTGTGRELVPPLPHEAVFQVAFSPDGTNILTAGADKCARLWNTATGKEIGPPLQHQDWVSAAAFSPDGKTVLTGSHDKTARLWDTSTGKQVGPSLEHQAKINAVAFSPDGKSVLTASDDKTAQLWETASGKRLGPALQHDNRVWAVAFSPDGSNVLTDDGGVRLWDTATGKQLGSPLQPQKDVRQTLSPDGKMVARGSIKDGTAILWDVATGKQIGRTMQHESWVLALALSPNSTSLLTGTFDKTARLWETATGLQLGPIMHHQTQVEYVAFSPDGKTLLTSSMDSTVRIWKTSPSRKFGPSFMHHGTVRTVAFSPDGKTVLTGSDDKTAQIWETSSGKPVGSPLKHQFPIAWAGFSSDGKAALTISGLEARTWEPGTGKPLGPPLEGAAAFSPNGKLVVVGSVLAETATGKQVGRLSNEAPIRAVFDPEGKTLATRSGGADLRFWETATAKPLTPAGQIKGGRSMAFRPDGKAVLIGSENGTARLWEVATGKPLGPPLQHQDAVMLMTFSANGETFLTGSRDKTVRVWTTATGKQLGASMPHQHWVTSATFSPDGRLVLTRSYDNSARFFETASGKQVGAPLRPKAVTPDFLGPQKTVDLAFSPDGRIVLAGGEQDNSARFWIVPQPLRGEPERILLWTQIITGTELDEHGGLRVLDAVTWQQRRLRLQELGGPPLD